jgi:ADP-heptose:LPS heptosyltransferase
VAVGTHAPARVVVLRALGLGDLLTVVPALRALREALPGHRLLLACPQVLAPLVVAAELADAVVDTDLRAGPGPAPERSLDPVLRDADLAVNLHGRGPQSHRLLLAANPRRLIAFRCEGVDDERLAPGPDAADGGWIDDEHEVPRWCRLLRAAGIPADPARLDISLDSSVGAGDVPAVARGAVVLHPGAASASRRWPTERWVALARSLVAAAERVVVTGGPGEVATARAVADGAGIPDAAVLAGRTDVVTLAAVVGAAAKVVCGDTGVAHLATALRTPSLVLFGPVPPSRWGPPADRPWHRALWVGRHGDPHGTTLDPGLAALSAADALAALTDLPDAPVGMPS